MSNANTALLQVRGLTTEFATHTGVARAVDGVSFDIHAGEIVGLVGESGSGKSVTGYSILGLIDAPGRIVGGSVRLDGQELIGMPRARLRALRGRHIAMVFQDPMSTLNAVLTVATQMALAMRAHGQPTRAQMRQRALFKRWPRSAFPTPSAAWTPTRTNSRVACASAWRSPSPSSTTRGW